ncbi:ComEA family DNA-binding protein [Desulfoplanes formicivorans]|uniref:Competence protein ComEA n=1 Tax=Desulfoplanes formicivorans TaxID=1592317 RepID=A0A194AKC9_9BACT|nr:helix-hairpin-helix domain-containing protein [Desulfoplanes formicivorans]GAU09511.1 competence protein ComEA [Desulfoplanes formicivorans]
MKQIMVILPLFAVLLLAAVPGFAGDHDGKQNLNTITVEQLAEVPGVGQELAQKIIDARSENGEFVDMDELLDVDGIDNSKLRKLKKHLYLEAASSCNC